MITFSNLGYMGRLGNQMFQFSSILGIAKRKNYKVAFPLENCSSMKMTGPLDPDSMKNIGVKADLLDCFDIPSDYFIPRSSIQIKKSYKENKFEYDSQTENIEDGTDLIGFFQTEKYFSDISQELKNIFSFKSEIIQQGNKVMSDYSVGERPISIHIRRGDYTLYPDHHPTCDINYYKKSLEDICKKSISFSSIIIFSDDKKWCKENLFNHIYLPFIIPDVDNPYVELYMMTQCKYHIIANSSFSWWGAWLADSELTIAPKKWFGKMIPHNTSDLYCPSWLLV